tara:strand:- start:1701 stop:1811 length:111 start_codon:yes stop_codon:yes gene_type:complete
MFQGKYKDFNAKNGNFSFEKTLKINNKKDIYQENNH